MVSAALVGASVVASVAATPAPAMAASPLDCTTAIYQISMTDSKVVSVPASAIGSRGTVTASDAFSIPSSVSIPNSLGISSGGTRAFFTGIENGGVRVYTYTASDGSITSTSAPAVPNRVAGAVDPVSGLYYFGSATAGDPIYAYDPASGRIIQTGTVPSEATATGANGDFAFSAAGDLFIVSQDRLVSVAASDIPQQNSTAQLRGTLISSGTFGVSNGIAFDTDGSLYVENTDGVTLQKVNPLTGAVSGTSTRSSVAGTDLGSCTPPSTLTLQKDVTSRATANDQFTLSIASGGTRTLSATTSGSATGVQDAKAGPTIGLAGTTYTLSETGAGSTDLAAYGSAYQCVDTSNGNEVVASGSARSFDLTYPRGVGRSVVCTFTNTAVQGSYTVQKTASVSSASPGDRVTYTVTVKNTGLVDYTDAAPASFSDDLSKVLDDATYNGDATQGAVVNGSTLSWKGALAKGASKTITYSVTVNTPDQGDKLLTNAVTPTGPGGSCVTGQCATNTPVRTLEIVKKADRSSVVPGQKITYTITVTNTGRADYTDATPASFSDDLSKVIDDADWNGDASATAGTLSYASPRLSWSGPVAAGSTVTVTYSVTVKNPDTGDKQIDNVVTSTVPGNNCVAGSSDPRCEANVPSGSFTVEKTVDRASAVPGDKVTYTVTVTNTGKTDYTDAAPASFRDDLSKVLDDATYNGDATQGAVVNGDTLSWSGALAKGAVVTITYSVTVNTPDAGDKVMTNVVTPTGPGGDCVAGKCSTTTPVKTFTVEKSASATVAAPGDKVTYTVTVTNTGQADYTDQAPASFSDDLSKVLDDATYNGDATQGAVVNGDTLSWSGALAKGAVVTITYSVTVNSPDTGDKAMTNVVAPTGPGGECVANACSTTTTVVPPAPATPLSGVSAHTGGAVIAQPSPWAVGGGILMLLIAALGAFVMRRRGSRG